MATIDLTATDTFYSYDLIPISGDKLASDILTFSESFFLDYGFFRFERPFRAAVLNNSKSYATIHRNLE